MNVMKDENTRMKTKVAFMQQEIDKKDKDIESLTFKLTQQTATATSKDPNSSVTGPQPSTMQGPQAANPKFESNLVNALKK